MATVKPIAARLTVDTINDRNNLTKINGLIVTVKDAIADINAGPGPATYIYDSVLDKWILIARDNEFTEKIVTESVLINDKGEAVLSNTPSGSLIEPKIINSNGVIIASLDPLEMTINKNVVSKLDAWSGNKLHVTYSYNATLKTYDEAFEGDVVEIDVN